MSISIHSHLKLTRVITAFVAAACFALAIACGGSTEGAREETATASQAVTAAAAADAGTITISGTVADAQFRQAGITITLSGSAQGQVVTDFSGTYQFTVKPGGSYSLTAAGDPNFFMPPFQSCLKITPSVVNLNNLTASTVVNFVGSGSDVITNCSPAMSSGATSGSFSLGGVLTSGGKPVPGALIQINGSTQGYRITDETGAYSFAVNKGSYSLNPSGACTSITPGVVNVNNLTKSTTENFQGTGCPPAPLMYCPTFDAAFGLSEPPSCNTVSTETCANDRLFTWAGNFGFDFLTVSSADCRFGQWNNPPIVNLFTEIGFFQQNDALNLFALQLPGCALQGNLLGPLPYSGVLIPPDLVRAKLSFTTADLSALTDDFIAAMNQTLTDNGSPAMTPSETAAFRAQIDFAASKVPGIVSSSKLTYSTCAH